MGGRSERGRAAGEAGAPWLPRSILGLRTGCAALALVAGLLLLLELSVGWLGLSRDGRSSLLAYQEVFLPVLVPGERADGTAVLRTVDPRLSYQSVTRAKPPGTLRVFAFGGSATAGLGFSPNVSFPRHLEELLARAHPGRTIEVVNLGVVAIASRQVELLVRDVLEHGEPDLVVVYSGNNEFLELHARLYLERNSSLRRKLAARLARTHVQRALRRALHGPFSPEDLPVRDWRVADEERLTQERIVREVRASPPQIESVLAEYEANLESMARAAAAKGVPLVLCGVAVNLEWRGREDLPADWIERLLGRPGTREEARSELDARLARGELDELERWELLFRRAELRRALRDLDGARADYVAALEADPHLRRALPRQSEAAQRVARRTGALFLDAPALFAAGAREGIVGFEHFYDYVHFTPRGAAELAVGIFELIRALPALRGGNELELGSYALDHERELRSLERDFLDARLFVGIGFDPARLRERDLWKYERLRMELDERLARDPRDVLALVYRANARSFLQDGAAGAEADYEAALAAGGEDPLVRANLERLRSERAARARR